MPRRPRTAKKLAQRIELSYFKRAHPLRRWRFILSVALPAIAIAWLAVAGVSKNRSPYSMGPVSAPHAFFGQKCFACHVADTVSFRHPVTDQSCLVCHDGPIHHADQVFTPSCSSCHVEHQGHIRLTAVRDSSCTQCHADLTTRAGAPHFVRSVLSFARHPEFAPLRANFKNPGTVKFSHAAHLAPNLIGPDGRRVKLACDDCHRPGAPRGSWRYGQPGVEAVTFSGGGLYTPGSAAISSSFHSSTAAQKRVELASMAPSTYANACFSCHPLQFDARFADSVPHDKPTIVHGFLVKKFQDYASAHPDAMRQLAALPRLPGMAVQQQAHLTRDEWVAEQVSASEDLLWRKTCAECHTMNFLGGSSLPTIAPSRITKRWLPHANFSHDAHRMVTCVSCHATIASSHLTADVNIPSVRVCQECHAARASAAPAGCFECHTYHDWSKERVYPGKFSLPDLLKSSRNFARRLPVAAMIGANIPRRGH
ncbi:MAG: cytochrome c3 family protein [Candidatus Acidiferrales bacterium]